MSNLFFDPPQLEVLYALTHLDGSDRQNSLGVTRIQYVSRDKADSWLRSVVDDLHTCHVSGHPAFKEFGQDAYDKLFEMWSRMTAKGIEDYMYPYTVSWYSPPISENALLQANLEGMVESLAMGRTDVSTVKEMIQEQFCQPAFNEGAFAEYFKLSYGSCPERILFAGQDRMAVHLMFQAFALEFNNGQTGGSRRGVSFFQVVPCLQDYFASEETRNGEIHYLQGIPSIQYLALFTREDLNTRITRRLVVVDIQDSIYTYNDLTYALNFFEQAIYKPIVLVILASEPLPIDGPTIYC